MLLTVATSSLPPCKINPVSKPVLSQTFNATVKQWCLRHNLNAFQPFIACFCPSPCQLNKQTKRLEETFNETWPLSSFFEYVQYTKHGRFLLEMNLFPHNQLLGYI